MQENNYDFNNDNQGNNDFPPRQPLGKKQKFAAAFLIVFALAFIGLWIAQFKKNLKEPFSAKTQKNTEKAQENGQNDPKKTDTDKDGLSDWDELNVYQTSPYLEDSDSDGFSDKSEILVGENPNCAKGQDCSAGDSLSKGDGISSDNEILSNLLGQADVNLNIGTSSLNAQGQNNLQSTLDGQADAKTLRKMLLDAGMDPNVLNKISDDVLMKSYSEILNKK